jgi:hypothetical protein
MSSFVMIAPSIAGSVNDHVNPYDRHSSSLGESACEAEV